MNSMGYFLKETTATQQIPKVGDREVGIDVAGAMRRWGVTMNKIHVAYMRFSNNKIY